MGKKKHKRMAQGGAPWGNPYGMTGAAEATGAGPYGGMDNAWGMGTGAWNTPGVPPAMAAGAPGALPGFDQRLLHGFQGLLGSRHTEQFVLGALIGAAAVYVLGDEEIRNKLVKTGMKLYANVAGGFEEMKEQMADMRAEVEAEQSA